MGIVLISCGVIAVIIGVWRGYVEARSALGPFMHQGEPTRTLIDAGRPVLERARVRLFLRRTALSIGWLLVALYGLMLASFGMGLR